MTTRRMSASLAPPEVFLVARHYVRNPHNLTGAERRLADALGVKPVDRIAGALIYGTREDAAKVATALQAEHPEEVIVAVGSGDKP